MTDPGGVDLGFIEAGSETRRRVEKRRFLAAIAVSATVTVVWLVYVTATGKWERVADHVVAAVTMIFGSFVGGATPQGGGAVAFPVFTKALGITPEVARSFSLFIQTVGMGTASAAILLRRRRVEWRAVLWGLPVSAVVFLLTIYLFADRSDPFLRPQIPGAYVKVTFTLIVAAMALITYLGSRVRIREVTPEIPDMNRRAYLALIILAALGGLAAGLTGSGADVFVYIFVGVLLAVDVKVGVPTSVLVMTGISILGFISLGLIEGQLSVALAGDRVTEVGGMSVDLEASTSDMFGLWLAAVPVVAWGGPLGAWVAARIKARQLVVFVVSLALLEVVSTILFVPELRSDAVLVAYTVLGGLVIGSSLWWIANNRRRVFAQPGVSVDRTLSRKDLDVSEGYREDLADDPKETKE